MKCNSNFAIFSNILVTVIPNYLIFNSNCGAGGTLIILLYHYFLILYGYFATTIYKKD